MCHLASDRTDARIPISPEHRFIHSGSHGLPL